MFINNPVKTENNKPTIFLDFRTTDYSRFDRELTKLVVQLCELDNVFIFRNFTIPFEGVDEDKQIYYVENANNFNDCVKEVENHKKLYNKDVLIITTNNVNIRNWIWEEKYDTVYVDINDKSGSFSTESMPDQIWNMKDFEEFIKCMQYNQNYHKYYFGERIGIQLEGNTYSGSTILKDFLDIPGKKVKADVIVSGRYFKAKDNRSYIHPLSKLILDFKRGDEKAIDLVKIFYKQLINGYLKQSFSSEHGVVDQVCAVPPKPNEKSRFECINEQDGLALKVECNLLSVLKTYISPKKIFGFKEKHMEIEGKIGCEGTVGKHVILIDDVYTSGATTSECAKVLYEHGAEKVTIMPLGFTQGYDFYKQVPKPKLTNKSNNEYILKFDENSKVYWGSKSFYDQTYKDYEEGVLEYLKGKVNNNDDKVSVVEITEDDLPF